MKQYLPKSLEITTQSLANTLPDGRIFSAKNEKNSNLRKMLHAMANEFLRLQNKEYELYTQYFPDQTVNLIDEWESALGIPDCCFDKNTTLEMRQKQVFAKFAKMHLTTEKQWIDLAAFFGYRIRIDRLSVSSRFTFEFPVVLIGLKEAKFTMVISFLDIPQPSSVFSCTFPILFSDNLSQIKCIFNYCKPANVNIIYRYLG